MTVNKIILYLAGAIFAGAFILVIIRFLSGPEDTWICKNGEWIKHGNPSSQKPDSLCPGDEKNDQLKAVNPTITATIPSITQTVKNGFIEGSLSYPSEFIPEDMKICAENLDKDQEFCTNNHIKDQKYKNATGYKIEVPPGQYQVYATLAKSGGNLPGYKAYYSEFVKCGLSIECKNHDPILVTVDAGKTISDIDPHDWYK